MNFQRHQIITLMVLTLFLVFTISPITEVESLVSDPPPYKTYIPLVQKDYDPSWQWQPLQQITLSPAPLDKPVTVIDSLGRLHIFWDVWPGNPQFIYHRYQIGSGWSDTEAIEQTLGASNLLAVPRAGPDGSVYIIWKNDLNFGGPYRIMYAHWKDGVWDPEAELHRITNNSLGGLLNLDTNGQPMVIVWPSDDVMTRQYFFCRPTAAGCTGKVEIPVGNSSILSIPDVLLLDHSGGVSILYEAYINFTDHQYFAYWKNSSFIVNDLDIGGSVNYRSGIVDGQKNILLYHTSSVPVPGGNVTGLSQQCLAANHTWKPEQVISGQSQVSAYQYAVTYSDAVVSAWQSSSAGPVTLDLLDNCNSTMRKTISLPPPSSSSWNGLVSLAASDQPKKICMVTPVAYASANFGVYCVNITG